MEWLKNVSSETAQNGRAAPFYKMEGHSKRKKCIDSSPAEWQSFLFISPKNVPNSSSSNISIKYYFFKYINLQKSASINEQNIIFKPSEILRINLTKNSGINCIDC